MSRRKRSRPDHWEIAKTWDRLSQEAITEAQEKMDEDQPDSERDELDPPPRID